MTLAGNSLSFGDVRKACKHYADEFLRDPKEHDSRGTHTVYVSQAKEASVTAEEQEGDSDVETALAALAGESDIDLEETDVQEILLLALPDWTQYSRKMEADAHTKIGLEDSEGPAREGHDLPFWKR